jgi:hypothetical protein
MFRFFCLKIEKIERDEELAEAVTRDRKKIEVTNKC